MGVVRDDSWRPVTVTPVALLHLRLFNYMCNLHYLVHVHVQNEYAYARPPSPLVYASRFILAQLEDPQAWKTTRKDSTRPATADSAHSTAARPHASRLAPRASRLVPHTSRTSTSHSSSSSSSRERERERPMNRRWECGMCTGTTTASLRPPPPSLKCQRRLRRHPRCICVHAPRTRTAWLCVSKPLHTPVVSGSIRMKWCTDDWECVSHYGRICQYQCCLPLSVAALAPPIPAAAAAAAPCLNLAQPYSNCKARVFYTAQELKSHVPKDTNSSCYVCPCTQRSNRAVESRRESDWTRSSATAVDLRATRGATPAHTRHPDSAPVVTAMENFNGAPPKSQASDPSSRAATV